VNALSLVPRPVASRLALASAVACSGLLLPSAAGAEPFLTRNQNPLLALYGLPSPLPARLPAQGGGRMAAVVSWSNAAKIDEAGDAVFTLDAETVEVRFHLEYAVHPNWAVRAEIPWRHIDGGTLDGLIEDWHGVFGLPGGSRRRLPRDQFLIEFRSDGVPLLLFEEGTSGLGDIPVALGYQLVASDVHALAAWLTVKTPVGDASDLTGSGALDLALSFALQSRINEDWRLFGQANAVWLGEGDVLTELQEDGAWSLLAGLSWNAWRSLDLTAQLEANSSVFDGDGTELSGDAVVLTLGGSYRTQRSWTFDLAISEDVQGGASPDIVFNFGVRRGF